MDPKLTRHTYIHTSIHTASSIMKQLRDQLLDTLPPFEPSSSFLLPACPLATSRGKIYLEAAAMARLRPPAGLHTVSTQPVATASTDNSPPRHFTVHLPSAQSSVSVSLPPFPQLRPDKISSSQNAKAKAKAETIPAKQEEGKACSNSRVTARGGTVHRDSELTCG